MYLVWTTAPTLAEAESLAAGAVERGLAACAQIDGPIRSLYRWEGRVENTAEYRLLFKCLPEALAPLEAWILSEHSYDTPEFVALRAERVGEKYLNWACQTAKPTPS